MALYVRFMIWYISLPSSAKQQREITKFKVFGEREHKTVNLSLYFVYNDGFRSDSQSGQLHAYFFNISLILKQDNKDTLSITNLSKH